MASKVVDSWWYHDAQCNHIGIIKTVDEASGEVKFRIGKAYGFDPEFDKNVILKECSRFYPEMIK